VAEIKLSDGKTIKTRDTLPDLRHKLGNRKGLVTIRDKSGEEYDINPAQIVYITEDRPRSGKAEFM
jgi:hypothetical protein